MSSKVVEEFSQQDIVLLESNYFSDNSKLQTIRSSKRECEALV